MTALATDAFTRANSGTLGANWTAIETAPVNKGFTISANTAVPNTFSANDSADYYTGITWPNDQYSKAQLTVTGTAGGGSGIGLLARALGDIENSGSAYAMSVDHAVSGNGDFYKFVAGGFTDLGAFTQSFADGDTWEIDAQGTAITVKHSGSTVISTTDSAVAAGNPGIIYSTTDTSASLDNWEGGDFGAIIPPGLGPIVGMEQLFHLDSSLMR